MNKNVNEQKTILVEGVSALADYSSSRTSEGPTL